MKGLLKNPNFGFDFRALNVQNICVISEIFGLFRVRVKLRKVMGKIVNFYNFCLDS